MLAEHYSPHHSTAMADLILYCLVDGESTSRAFEVEVPATRTVTFLKDKIKEKKAPEFDDIAADKLTLWHVCVAITDDDELPVLLDRLNEKKKLGPATRISKVFTEELPEETVHIMVQRPPQGNATHCSMQAFQRTLDGVAALVQEPTLMSLFSLLR
jgi:hypothetical protein